MTPQNLDSLIKQAAALVHEAQNIVAFTGAGISTPSGIPDFRSPDSGAWENADPTIVASLFAFQRDPRPFFEWIRPATKLMLEAQPNPAHLALADLEKMGKVKAVVTQNIDNLHGRAGSNKVFELHGHMREVTCLTCRKSQKAAQIIEIFLADGNVPYCDCGGVLKPNVILFGEQLPFVEFAASEEAMRQADLVMVVGSSLEVTPAADLPAVAMTNGAKGIIVNLQPTYFDRQAEVVIPGDVADVLPRIVDLVQTL